jgi:Right handed beta helix region
MTPARLALATAAAVAGLTALAITSGSASKDAVEPAPRLAANRYIVDTASVGGRCRDERPARRARSESRPWCSLARAVSRASAGATVYLRAGDYPRLDLMETPRTEPLTLRSYPGERVTLEGADLGASSRVRLVKVRVTDGVAIGPGARRIGLIGNRIAPGGVTLEEDSAGVRIVGNLITTPENDGVVFSGAPDEPPIANVLISGNHFDDIGATGVNVRHFRDVVIDRNEFEGVRSHDGVVHPNVIRTYGGGTGLTVSRNFIHHNEAICFFIKDGAVSDVLLENNLVVRNEGYAVQVYDVDGLRLVNNTVFHNKWSVLFREGARNVVVKNNILNGLGVSTDEPVFSYKDFNYVSGDDNVSGGPHALRRGLRFVAPDRLDYRLARGSRGIDAGSSDGAPGRDRLGAPRVDVDGVRNRGEGRRDYYDIGAHEYRE